ncbi:MAG TPA: SIMPL domain-containing protein [Planctomycetota bacterium]|nr:SIMPL domain-containing protein [Planctomycetota bacterium]
MHRVHIILGGFVVVSLAVGGSFVTSTWVASRAYLKRGGQQEKGTRTLDVTGSARKLIVSDLAIWTIRIGGEGKTIEDAYQKMSASGDKVREFLSQKGVPADAVKSGPIRTETHYRKDEKGNSTREITSHELSRAFEIRTSEVRLVEKASGEVTEILRTGAHVESLAPDFVYTKLSDLKIAMIGEATRNARERAEQIAAGSGCRIGSVKDARAGVLQVTRPWSTETTSSGANDTSSVEKDVMSVVHLTLTIDR